MKNAHFYVFNVGHGVCTLLTGEKGMKKEGESNSYCAVFDCGSKAYNLDWKKEDVVKKMAEIIRKQGQIDDLIISHQDEDHSSMLLELFFELNEVPKGQLFGKANKHVWKYSKQQFFLYAKDTDRKTYAEYQRFIHDIDKVNMAIYSITVTWNSEDSYKDLLIDKIIMEVYSKEDWSKICSIMVFQSLKKQVLFRVVEEFTASINFFHATGQKVYSFREIDELIDEIKKELKREMSKQPNLADEIIFFLKNIVDDVRKSVVKNKIDSMLSKTDVKVKPIIFFIKRIVFGGSHAGCEYNYLISFFKSIQNYYEQTDHKTQIFRAQYGGYLKLNDNEEYNENQEQCIQALDTSKDILNYKARDITGELIIIRNASSVVTEFIVDENSSILLPGDVTVHKFDCLTTRKLENPSRIQYFLAPHHGSDCTNFTYEKVGSEVVLVENKKQPLAKLLEAIRDCTIIVSAYHSVNPHPGCHFIELAKEHSFNGVKKHNIVYTNGIDKANPIGESVEKALYTTNRLISTKKKLVDDSDAPPKSQEPYLEFIVPLQIPVSLPTPPVSAIRMESHSSLRIPPDDCFI